MAFRAPAPVTRSPVQSSPSVVVMNESPPSSSECSCVDCCFKCDSDYKWYHLQGKGKFFKPIGPLKRTGYIYPGSVKLV